MRFSVGQELEGLEFIEVLRSTEQSVAYKVRDAISRRLEYLKLVPASVNGDNEALERLLREARVHASLDHPNIARFYSARRVDGEMVITREWVEGESLASKLATGPLPLAQGIDYATQTLAALAYAHAKGVVHRNITAEKLLITEQGVVKLTGFDLARATSDLRLTKTGVTIGSVHYMSPEQVRGGTELDPRSDLYSFGVVLYQTVTGSLPFECENDFDVLVAHVESEPKPASERDPEIPQALDNVIRKALGRNADERYQTAESFLADLQGCLAAMCSRDVKQPADLVPIPAPLLPQPQAVLAPEEVLAPVATLKLPPELDEAQRPPDTLKMVGLAVVGFTLGILLFVLGVQILH